jgi:chain length determinant protein (polysaccharide antigen chain regulator)
VNYNASSFPLSLHVLKRQWRLLGGAFLAGLAVSTAIVLVRQPLYEVQAYLDLPYSNELAQLNRGRTQDSGLAQYTPDQVYTYFTRRLLSDEALQRFFHDTYLPAQSQQPASAAVEQALFAHMQRQVLRIAPPPPKGRMQYRVQVTAPTGAQAAQWAQAFLAQVEQDAKTTLLADSEKSISLQIHNMERDWQERLQTSQSLRQDRLVQLGEALQVAKAIGQHEPQITRAQPPLQDGLASYMNGSQLYARGTKSLQAEIDVLKHREDDAPFVNGLRAAQSQLRLLKEHQAAGSDFNIYHVDGQVAAPEQSKSPKPLLILMLGGVLGGLLGGLLALWREGVLQRLLRDDSSDIASIPQAATDRDRA